MIVARKREHHGPWMSLTWKCCWQDSSKLLLDSSVQFVHPRPLCRNHVMVQLTPCFPFPTSNCKVPTWWITTFINGLNANPGTIWLKGKNRWSHPSRNNCFWLWMALARNALIQACGGISLLPRMSSIFFLCKRQAGSGQPSATLVKAPPKNYFFYSSTSSKSDRWLVFL